MRMVPTINSAGTRLYVGVDQGRVLCLNTALNPVQRVSWSWTMSGQTTYPVRSGIAYDPVAPKAGGGTEEAIYFQANDGWTYSLNAATGAVRWQQNTGNFGGPPPSGVHSVPWSCTPVLDLNGTVFVGSANGYLYCLSPLYGAVIWKVALNASGLTSGGEPIESTPAIGENGWIYVATRSALVGNEIARSHVYAIDPARATANPNNAVEKIVWISEEIDPAEPGVIAGLVLDQCGTVLVPAFHSFVLRLNGVTGEQLGGVLYTLGKLCQTPALNRNGMLIVGTSVGEAGERSIQGIKVFPDPDPNANWAATSWGSGGQFGDFLGGVLLRANSVGWTYLADANPDTESGAVYRLTAGSPSMPGDWPTLGCGNRRQHKARTYPYTLVELGPFYQGVPESQGAFSVDAMGRVVGHAHGNPSYPENFLPIEWYGARWNSSFPSLLGDPYYALPRQWALGHNLAGVVVGYSTYGAWTGPIVWRNGFASTGTREPLPLPTGYANGEARDVSADNTIIGFSYLGADPKVLRWNYDPWSGNWTPWEIGAPEGGKALANAISGSRRICGKAVFTAGGPWVGFTSQRHESSFAFIQPLGAFGGSLSEAYDVNDTSGTVGWAHKRIAGTDYPRAFLVPPDVYQLAPAHELPGFTGQTPTGTWRSYAYGVNGCAQVVGSAQNTSGAYRAYLWQPGWANLKDLTALAPSGWVLTSAAAISDAGHIIGSGTKNGASRQWLMVPTPQE